MTTPNVAVGVNTSQEVRDVDDVEQDARSFWEDGCLRSYVPEDVFVLGVIALQDLQKTIGYISHQEQVQASQQPASNGVQVVTPEVFDIPADLEIRLRNLQFHQRDSIKRHEQRTSLMRLSRAHFTVLATCALAAMTQGWDQSSMNGANIQWPQDFGLALNGFNNYAGNASDFWIFGWLNAAPFVLGASVGSLITDPLINEGRFGRRWAIILGGLFSFTSVIGAAFTSNWIAFMFCRMLLGVGMGAKASVVPIFISEIAPEYMRGRLSMSWQLFDTCGLFLGSAANLIVFHHSKDHPNWRFMIALPSLPALLFLTLAIFCVESPRWLMKRNKMPEALSALIQLHGLPSRTVACGELYWIFCRLKEEERVFNAEVEPKKKEWLDTLRKWTGRSGRYDGMNRLRSPTGESQLDAVASGRPRSLQQSREPTNGVANPSPNGHALASHSSNSDPDAIRVNSPQQEFLTSKAEGMAEPAPPPDPMRHKLKKTNLWSRLCLLFLVKRMRNGCVMIAQQACGINVLAFMSTMIYSKLGEKEGDTLEDSHHRQLALEFSLESSAVNFLCTLFAIPLIDRKGRRYLLKYSFPAMALCLFIIAGVLSAPNKEHRKVAFMVFTFLFTAAFSVGEGPTAFVVSSEVYPLIVRELGMSFAVLCNFFWAGVLALLIPVLATVMRNAGFWCFFGALNLIFWRLSIWLVQETLHSDLENIDKRYSESKWNAFHDMFEVRLWKRVFGKQAK